MDQVVNDEASTAATPEVQESASDAIRRGYEKVAEPDKVQEQQTEASTASTEAAQTVETPPANDQLKDLMTRVERIPELEKRLRDEGGRYGALKQQLEQLQQKIAESTTSREVAANTADAKELMKDLRDEFPELADKLEGAFSRVMATKGGIDQGGIDKLVSERLAAEREAARASSDEKSFKQILEFHPDFEQTVNLPEFATWKETLHPRLRARLDTSTDPFFVADQVDSFKEWQKSKAEGKETAPAAPSKRLADAVLPTTGQRVATQKTADPKASIRAGYERVAGKRL
jgi:molecular chaperone GrpE (heat shock protein)